MNKKKQIKEIMSKLVLKNKIDLFSKNGAAENTTEKSRLRKT